MDLVPWSELPRVPTGIERRLQNLIPLNKRSKEEAMKIQTKGGYAAKGTPAYGKTHCRRCKLPCPLRDEGIKNGWKCRIPDTKRWIIESRLNPERLTDAMIAGLAELKISADGTQDEEKRFNRRKAAFYAMTRLKEVVSPPVQHSVNLNFDFTKTLGDAYRERMEKERQRVLKEMETYGD